MKHIANRLALAGLLIAAGLYAQAPAEFEVASIKPAAPMPAGRMMVGMQGGPGTPSPAQMTFTNVSIADIMQQAYEVKGYQISGPAWLQSTRFDISAKVPAGATKEQSKIMLQHLLAERFKLVLHHSTKEESMYALLVAKGGPKLTESAKDDPAGLPVADGPGRSMDGAKMDAPKIGKDGMPELPPAAKGRMMVAMVPGGRMRMMANGTTIPKFLDVLANQLDRPVTDMTGLTGTYDITLDFAPDPSIMQAKMAAMGAGPPPPGMGGPEGGAGQDPSGAATIFSALTEQLGLRLEARTGPVDLLVIDTVEKTPTEN